ncbi:hypothetical protein ACH4UM_00955 [Streptomyces sp. NPDC020801]|uniref:hypothetical protein n=1 Tax=Streptomyces sp. NPDC020801 TaxID=3365093 RepID=UPI00378A1987
MDDQMVLSMRFAWHPDQVNSLQIATSSESISSLTSPVRLASAYETTIGNNGAISTAPCKTDVGSYFTLTLRLATVNPTTDTRRASIEKFMRAYFPATVKTLGCQGVPH